MKRVEKRIKELSNVILGGGASEEDYAKSVAELKALRELIATKKALAAYVEDYGDDNDDSEPRQKRTSDTEWH